MGKRDHNSYGWTDISRMTYPHYNYHLSWLHFTTFYHSIDDPFRTRREIRHDKCLEKAKRRLKTFQSVSTLRTDWILTAFWLNLENKNFEKWKWSSLVMNETKGFFCANICGDDKSVNKRSFKNANGLPIKSPWCAANLHLWTEFWAKSKSIMFLLLRQRTKKAPKMSNQKSVKPMKRLTDQRMKKMRKVYRVEEKFWASNFWNALQNSWKLRLSSLKNDSKQLTFLQSTVLCFIFDHFFSFFGMKQEVNWITVQIA